jgi:Beta-lactamase
MTGIDQSQRGAGDCVLMGETGSANGWTEVLSRLDRHGFSGQLTPDTTSMPDLMEMYRIPGVSVAVAGLDGAAWSAGYGTTGTGLADLVSSRTAFQACSISKHVTAFGALRLVADGVLDLDGSLGAPRDGDACVLAAGGCCLRWLALGCGPPRLI